VGHDGQFPSSCLRVKSLSQRRSHHLTQRGTNEAIYGANQAQSSLNRHSAYGLQLEYLEHVVLLPYLHMSRIVSNRDASEQCLRPCKHCTYRQRAYRYLNRHTSHILNLPF
jgi:hypothetical protein